MTFFYKELDLPPIPEELLVHLPEISSETTAKDIGYGYRHFKNGVEIHSCTYSWTVIDEGIMLSWLKQNILPIQKHLADATVNIPVYMQTAAPRHPDGGAHIVHSDFRRIAGLNYHWALGGDAVVNRWYKEKGRPLLRRKMQRGLQSDSGHVKYDDLEILEEVIIKKNCWYLINVSCLHDVQNITSTRQGITVPFISNKALELAGFTEHP